jgi:hypothetical protein
MQHGAAAAQSIVLKSSIPQVVTCLPTSLQCVNAPLQLHMQRGFIHCIMVATHYCTSTTVTKSEHTKCTAVYSVDSSTLYTSSAHCYSITVAGLFVLYVAVLLHRMYVSSAVVYTTYTHSPAKYSHFNHNKRVAASYAMTHSSIC